MAVGRL